VAQYILPVFNLTCNIWTRIAPPPGNPKRLSSPCNLAYGKRVNGVGGGGDVAQLLLPKGTDIRDGANTTAQDYVEVPAGSGCYYGVFQWFEIGKGFSNEHRIALLQKAPVIAFWPTPTP